MGKNNNIIEINGKRYNATTGTLISSAPQQQTAISDIKKPAVDRNASHQSRQPVPKSSIVPNVPATVTKPTMHDVVRQPASNHVHHKPSSSRALMRRAVQKPDPALKRRVKAQGATDTLPARALPSVPVKYSAQGLNEERLQRAKKVMQSQRVSHFSESVWAPPAVPQTKPQPKLHQAGSPRAAGSHHKISQQSVGGIVPAATSPARAANPSSRRRKAETTSELLERAIAQADSHQTPPLKTKRRKFGKRGLGFSAAIVLAIAVTGVIVNQNLASIRMQVVSAKAGFSAVLPAYQPAGYSMGPLAYSNGVISTKFQSNSDSRHYTITQKRSSWDSQTLRDSFVVYADTHYQTIQTGGQTVYLYGKDDATWVSNGIWYVVQGDGSLSNHQLIKLASSM